MNTKPKRLTLFFTLAIASLAFTAALKTHAQETERVYLSGKGKDDPVAWKFQFSTGEKTSEWTTTPVPSNWEMQGYGSLHYRRDLPEAFNETGHYAREFPVPAYWKDKRVFIVFEGVATDATVSINGKPAGPMHQGAYYRFKYEIASILNFGATNKLDVTVAKHSANKSINGAERNGDFWVFGGIFRPVYLEVQPQQFIERVAINALADGNFSADVFFDGAQQAGEVEGQIQTIDGRNIGKKFSQKISGDKTTLRAQIAYPKLWTAETPNLYRVQFRLKQNGRVIHTFTERFGFRTFEVRDGDGFYLNGQRIVLKGANRHSFWPESGRTLSEAVHRLDIKALKDANMNAVRMSHYPPDKQFLELCDELGLYVLNELAGWHANYDDEVGPALVRAMVTRDVNHPSVLFWDNGNEGGFNFNLDALFAQHDPQQRRVLHPWTTFSGVNTTHYLTFDLAAGAASGIHISSDLKDSAIGYHTYDFENPKRYIYMPTEFQHGLYDGGAGAGMDDMWKLMSASKYNGGGFIWALVDEGVKRPDNGAIDLSNNEAPDGIVGPYREREGSFYTVKEIWSPIEIIREIDGTFIVRNHYGFINAAACKYTWQLRRFAAPTDAASAPAFTVLNEGIARAPSIAPGASAPWKIDLPEKLSADADALAVRVDDPEGRELWTWVWPLPAAEKHVSEITTNPAGKSISAQAKESSGTIEITAGSLTVRISKTTGLLTAVQRDGKTFSLANGPVFTAKPEPHALKEIVTTADGADQVVTVTFDVPPPAPKAGPSNALKKIIWRVRANGWVDCDYTYSADKEKKEYLGVTFDYPEENVKAKRWLGDGPFHVWKNRLRGVTPGVWANDYNNTVTGYRDWIYPEFKGFFANVRWLQLTTTEGDIMVVPSKNIRYLQVLTLELPPEKIVGQSFARFPKCGLGLMQAISPIGSKFKPASDMGLQSQLNAVPGEFSGSVSFYFGKLPR